MIKLKLSKRYEILEHESEAAKAESEHVLASMEQTIGQMHRQLKPLSEKKISHEADRFVSRNALRACTEQRCNSPLRLFLGCDH